MARFTSNMQNEFLVILSHDDVAMNVPHARMGGWVKLFFGDKIVCSPP